MKLGPVFLIGLVLGIVFGLLTFMGAGLGAYWVLIGGLVVGFLTGFLLKDMKASLGFGFLSAFVGVTVGGMIVVFAIASLLSAVPLLGGFLGILLAIVAVVFGLGAGIIALIGAPIGVVPKFFGIGLNYWLDMQRIANQGARWAAERFELPPSEVAGGCVRSCALA